MNKTITKEESVTENNDFKISVITVWFLTIGYFPLLIIGSLGRIQQYELSRYFLIIGLCFLFSSWLIIYSDIRKNKVYNKLFWTMSMFILPFITPVFYLMLRKKLINLGQKY